MRILICLVIVAAWLIGCTPVPGPGPDPGLSQSETSFESNEPLAPLTPQPETLTLTSPPTKTTAPTHTATLTASITRTATQTPTPTPLPRQALLDPMNHQWQTLNNCHRASIATLMAYYDVWFTQDEYDLGMDNLPEFVSPYGLTSRIYAIRYADVTSSYAVRWLLTQDIPVIMGQKLSIQDRTWHYRVVQCYNDSSQSFTIDDPLRGNISLAYETFDKLVRGEGQIIPIYPIKKDYLIVSTMSGWQMKLIEYP